MLHKSLAVEYNQKGMDNFSFIKGENSYFNILSINSILSKYTVFCLLMERTKKYLQIESLKREDSFLPLQADAYFSLLELL